MLDNFSKKFNHELLKGAKKICVACSGGMDSVAMLHYLSSQRDGSFNLFAVNIDHDLRETSKRDSDFVKKLCKELNVSLFYKKVKVKTLAEKQKMGIEECAREERYKFFDNLVSDKKVDLILTAHHVSDDVESIFLNILRGCHINGLTGIKEKRKNIVRPMLAISKEDINDYIDIHNLSYVIDETNFSNKFSRNFIRNEIFPSIETRYPKFKENLKRLKQSAITDQLYFDKQIRKTIEVSENQVKIPIKKIKDPGNKALATRCFYEGLARLGLHKDIYSVNIDDIYHLINKDNGKSVCLKDGICAFKDYDYITLEKNPQFFYQEFEIKEGTFFFENKMLKIEKSETYEKSFSESYLDFDKLPQGAILRKRKNGDVFLRQTGTKKLKDFLIDRKIPSRMRDDLLVVASGQEVHMVVNVECGRNLLIDENSKNIYKIIYRNTEEKNV